VFAVYHWSFPQVSLQGARTVELLGEPCVMGVSA
jgi:hypothetical protein